MMAGRNWSSWIFGGAEAVPSGHGVENVEDVAAPGEGKPQEQPPTIYDVPQILVVMKQEGEESVKAARQLYELCDVGHKQNRVTLVASGQYDVIVPLIQCLTTEDDEKLHFVCLCLNNLSIPDENKRIMAMERGLSKKLFGNLSQVMAQKKKEAYLCCICLMNLSFLEECIPSILQYIPPRRMREPRRTHLEHPDSMLKILEELIKNSSRGMQEFRWAIGLVASLARHEKNAKLIGKTSVPGIALQILKETKNPKTAWKENSLEDFALFLIMRLAEAACESVMEGDALEVVKKLLVGSENDIQYLKATLTCTFLEAPWSVFPKYGIPAAACISELMGNTFERQGKKHMYANHVFKLTTATKAYQKLAEAAAQSDSDSESESNSNMKVVALPTAVALLFQIVSDVALDAVDFDDDSYTPDEKAAEYAVGAMLALMPTLLKAEDPPRQSKQTERACTQIRQVLMKFIKKTKSASCKEYAKEAAQLFKEAPHSAMPILEASYELWIQYNS